MEKREQIQKRTTLNPYLRKNEKKYFEKSKHPENAGAEAELFTFKTGN